MNNGEPRGHDAHALKVVRASWLLPAWCGALKPVSRVLDCRHTDALRTGREEGAATTAEGPIRGSARTLHHFTPPCGKEPYEPCGFAPCCLEGERLDIDHSPSK